MPMIRECIVTTLNAEGVVHIAPLGLIEDGDGWVIGPFRPSATLDNLRTTPFAVANFTDDVLVFAGCLTGNKNWPTRPAEHVPGAILDGALSHLELSVESIVEDDVRPRFHCRIVHTGNHGPFKGFNRAQAAVIETAILASRLKMLPREKVESELAYQRIAVDKTAGPRELEAWRILNDKIENFYAQHSDK